MKDLARAIFDASPTTAHYLIEAIDGYRVLLKNYQRKGFYELDQDGSVHREVDAERFERLDRLREELMQLRYAGGE